MIDEIWFKNRAGPGCTRYESRFSIGDKLWRVWDLKDIRVLAGGDYYEAAADGNREVSKTMQRMAIEFMAAYLAKGYCRMSLLPYLLN